MGILALFALWATGKELKMAGDSFAKSTGVDPEEITLEKGIDDLRSYTGRFLNAAHLWGAVSSRDMKYACNQIRNATSFGENVRLIEALSTLDRGGFDMESNEIYTALGTNKTSLLSSIKEDASNMVKYDLAHYFSYRSRHYSDEKDDFMHMMSVAEKADKDDVKGLIKLARSKVALSDIRDIDDHFFHEIGGMSKKESVKEMGLKL